MARMVFINLPVKDLKASMAFYAALGFTNNPQFTDDTAACMVWSDAIFVMLLTHKKFLDFTKLPISDAHKSVQMLSALSLDDRAGVDAFTTSALKHGGSEHRPTQDLGFMYSRSVQDLDGHIWEPFFMDMSAMPQP